MRVAVIPVILFLTSVAPAWPQTTQEHVHSSAHEVMPFDIAKTVHVFRMTELGGIQQVVIRDPSFSDQVGAIRQHLRHEAARFQAGEFADPAKLHGVAMPGLDELQDGASGIQVSYRDLPGGGEMTFETKDLKLLTAIHRWFGAQLSEHGADARAE